MTTATSCSNQNKFRSMYLGALRRGAPLGIFYALLLFALFPLMYIITLATMRPMEDVFYPIHHLRGYAGIYNSVSMLSVPIICAIIPIVFGVTIFSYLHNKSSTDVFHALPMKRQTLFTANYLAGITLIWIPLIVSFLVVAIAGARSAAILEWLYSPARIFTELLGWLVVVTAVFTITAVIAVQAGNSFDTVMFSLAFCGMYPVILFFAKTAAENLLLGFTGRWSTGLMNDANLPALSPFTVMGYRLTVGAYSYEDMASVTASSNFAFYFRAIVIWAVITVALYFVANLLYARRKSELAGRTTASSALNCVVKYIVTFVFGIIFGLLLHSSFNSRTMFWVGAFIGGCIAFTVFEAIAARGFKTFPKAFVHMAISVGLTVGYVAVFLTGGLGYETRIPAADRIESVSINYNGRYGYRYLYDENGMIKYTTDEYYSSNTKDSVKLTSPEAIELVRKMHSNLVQTLRARDGINNNWYDQTNIRPQIAYHLKDGKTIKRLYTDCPADIANMLSGLEDLEEFKRQTNPAFLLKAGQLKGIDIMNRLGLGNAFENLTDEQQKQLLEALQNDTLNEQIKDILNQTYDAVGYIHLIADESKIKEMTEIPSNSTILITEQHTNTIAWLKSNSFYKAMEIDKSKLSKVGISTQNSKYMGMNSETIYFYANPVNQMMDGDEVFSNEYSDDTWFVVDDDRAVVEQLYELARNNGSITNNDYQLYFQYGDSKNALLLYLPENKMPQELANRYKNGMGDDLNTAGTIVPYTSKG